ncbi:MAG: 23S rRNA (pseudouridine(1915)-N(3))-methyltransferase RlmH [Gammaproteobacteria bacterium]|nr:23S rRNA (pseudouridine(1915)-N(3))-methyltransferase RlmH [Gammaproteobacteria bacterium]
MRIRFIVIGKKMPDWVEHGYNEYTRRLPRELKIELIEIPLAHRGKNADIERMLAKEGEAMMAAIKKTDYVVSLDVDGRSWTTKQLAGQLQKWQGLGSDICLLVGGPDGLSPLCKNRAQQHWSLSTLTYPHPLVRVIVAEALYRAWSINSGHPYHRE